MTDRQRLIELALKGLESERDRISEEINQLQQELRGGGGERRQTSPNKGRTMSAAQKRKISATLRQRWAERRGAKPQGRGAQAPSRPTSPNKGKVMSAAQKRKISETLKKRWAERRRAQKAA